MTIHRALTNRRLLDESTCALDLFVSSYSCPPAASAVAAASLESPATPIPT